LGLTRVLTNGEALADALSLFRASPSHSKYNVSDIYTYLQLPLQYKTIELYYEGDKPVGLITWCWLKKQDADLFLADQYHPNPDDYKLDEGSLLCGPTTVMGADIELLRQDKDTYDYPVAGWYWFDSEEEAREFLGLPLKEPEEEV
jgi:hypothetical protein